VGSIFERSHIPIHKWLLAFRLMTSSKKGVSTHQIHRTLGITYKSAWFLTMRIREAMTDTDPTPLGGEGKTVESDETFYGRKPDAEDPWYFDNERGWRKKRMAWSQKIPVVTLVERGGKSRSVKAENVTAREIRRIVLQNADTKSALMTDAANSYSNFKKPFTSHESVKHSKD
jgi:hypothetical protein